MIEVILTIVNVLFLIIIVGVAIYAYYSIYAVMDDVDSLAKDMYGKTEKIKHKVAKTKRAIVETKKTLSDKIHDTKEDIDKTHGSHYQSLNDAIKSSEEKLTHDIEDLSDTVRKDRNTNIGLIAQVNHRINKQNVNTQQNLEAIDQTFGIVAGIIKHRDAQYADLEKAHHTLTNDFVNFTNTTYPQDRNALKDELIKLQQDNVDKLKKDITLQGGHVDGDLTITGKLTASDLSGAGVDRLKADILSAVPKTAFTNVQEMKVAGNVDIGGNLTGVGVDKFKKDLLASVEDLRVSGKLFVSDRDILKELDRLNARVP